MESQTEDIFGPDDSPNCPTYDYVTDDIELVLFQYLRFVSYRTDMEAVANIRLSAESIVECTLSSIEERKVIGEAMKNIHGMLRQGEFLRLKERQRITIRKSN